VELAGWGSEEIGRHSLPQLNLIERGFRRRREKAEFEDKMKSSQEAQRKRLNEMLGKTKVM